MISERPLADLRTERHEPVCSSAPRTSLRLHGVPVPSRVLGFGLSAWQPPSFGEISADRPADDERPPLTLYRIDGTSRAVPRATSNAA